jgi:DNA-binding NtrC family response regulator
MTERHPPREPPSSVAPRSASEIFSFGAMLGSGSTMQGLFATLPSTASVDTPVLVIGGPGTGKTLLAQTLHESSPRRDAGLLFVDCGARPDELTARLATGNSKQNPFVLAGDGTIVLENVTELPLALQAQLAAVLGQQRSLRPPAGTLPRLIATSSEPLQSRIGREMFRGDLFEQLAGIALALPPLRERPEDIPVLAAHFLEVAQGDRPATQRLTLRQPALRELAAHDWPGNVAELRAVVERAALRQAPRTPSESLGIGSPWGMVLGPAQFDATISYREARAEFERDFEQRYVAWLLRRHGGNVSAAAREARMDRKHLSDLARRHGLRSAPSTRPPAREPEH